MKKSISNRKYNRIMQSKGSVIGRTEDGMYSLCYDYIPNQDAWLEYYHCSKTGMCYKQSVPDEVSEMLYDLVSEVYWE